MRNRKIKELDSIFSKYIRLRDCNKNGRCISCNSPISYSTCDAGHFISRRHMSTRFCGYNVNAQCVECNRFKNGNIENYRNGLIRKYGEGIVKMIETNSNSIMKVTTEEIQSLIEFYKKEIKEYG